MTCLSDGAASGDFPFARARRGRVQIELPQIAVQTQDAARITGMGDDVLRKIPWRVLPYARHGKHRWYLVAHVQLFAERLMALRITRGESKHIESLLALAVELPSMEQPV